MQVFKLYFKLLKSVAPALIIYGIMFIGLTSLLSSSQGSTVTNFEERKVNTAIVNYNEDNVFVQDFLEYLSDFCNFKYYDDEESTALADDLFFGRVQYIITIPYQFGEDFLTGKDVAVEKKTLPESIYSASVDHAINNYLNTARVYLKSIPNITKEELIANIRKDTSVEAEVAIESYNKDNRNDFYSNYFNSSSYILLACCLLGIGMVMMSFFNIHIFRRNVVTPMSIKNMNLQLISGNVIFVLVFDILFIILGIILNKDKAVTENVLLFWLNLIVFSISAMSISYLSTLLVKTKEARDALSTVIPLGLAFISGSFIPQEFLASSVLKLASFTPVYWFVKGNNVIGGLSKFNWDNVAEVFYYMAIQIGFAAALFALSLVISKNKSQKSY